MMWSAIKKTLLHPTTFSIGLVTIFAFVVLGCNAGSATPSMPTMHNSDLECASMFASDFIVSQKDIGSKLALLFLTIIVSSSFRWATVLKDQQALKENLIRNIVKSRRWLLKIHDHVLQLSAQGILHPQIY